MLYHNHDSFIVSFNFFVKVDASLKVEEVEIYYDPAELFGGLLSGGHTNYPVEDDSIKTSAASQGCPFTK